MSLVKTYKNVHTHHTRCVCVTRDNKYVVSGSWDKTVRITCLDTGELVRVIDGHHGDIYYVYVTSDNKYVVSASYNDLTLQFQINYLDNGELLRVISINPMIDHILPLSFCITPDDKYLVIGLTGGDIRITRLDNGELVRVIKGHTANVKGLTVTSDNKFVVSISDDKTLRIICLDTGELFREVKRNQVSYSNMQTICITSDSKYVALLLKNDTIQIIRLDTGESVHTLAISTFTGFQFTPDNKYIVSCGLDTVQLTRLDNGKLFKKFKLGIQSTKINVSPDGNHVVVGGFRFGSIAVVVISNYFARRQWAQVLLWKKDFKIFHQYPGLIRYIGNRLLSFC